MSVDEDIKVLAEAKRKKLEKISRCFCNKVSSAQ